MLEWTWLTQIGAGVARFRDDTRGALIVTFALLLPPLSVIAVGAIELAEVSYTKAQLQGIVDSTSLRGAADLALDQSAATQVRTQVYGDSLAQPLRGRWSITTSIQADPKAGSMTAIQDAWRPSFFGSLLPPGGWNLHVTATSTQNAKKPLCVLGLQTGGTQVLHLLNTATVTAGGCAVQSDSDLVVDSGASLKAGAVQTYGAATGSVSPAPVTDVAATSDPFASLAINISSSCNDNGVKVSSGTVTLNAGVHCGNVEAKGNGTVVLNPGDHFFPGVNIDMKDNGAITGTDVVLVFNGQTQFSVKGNGSFSLEGRQSGPYAGFVIVTDRSYTGTLDLSTTSAHRLTGTIYLPNATLAVSGTVTNVADQSPWTVIVAKMLTVSGSPNLVINSNYAASSIPVPGGVGPGNLRVTR